MDVLKQIIDSNDFTVGGGSASALAGAMAAGMSAMVARLSLKKPVNLAVEEYEALIKEADELAVRLHEGAYKDTEAYCMIKDAFALPKETDEQKAARSAAVSKAGTVAANTPRDNGMMCKRANEIARRLDGNSNPAASSDLASAIYLSESGVKGCLLNVEANLSLIKDEAVVAGLQKDIAVLKAACGL